MLTCAKNSTEKKKKKDRQNPRTNGKSKAACKHEPFHQGFIIQWENR